MSASGPPRIDLTGVSKWYGFVLGLNEVSATFEQGVSGLLGPNGAGKSTLMKLACGMLRPSLGSVRLGGRDPFDDPVALRRLGHCPEQDAVYPRASILDVTTYLTRLCGYTRREARERARGALERVGLSEVLGRSAAGFSKGMRQRAKLAQAIAHEPDILVLDEPLNGLDPPGRREMSDLIHDLGDSGACVLVSSHILHEVQELAPRVLLLHTGRVLAEGTVAEIRSELPEHPLTVWLKTSEPAALARRLLDEEGISRVALQPRGLEVVTRRPEALFDAVAAAAAEGLPVDALVPVDEDLEAVFRYLTR